VKLELQRSEICDLLRNAKSYKVPEAVFVFAIFAMFCYRQRLLLVYRIKKCESKR
jgi:hypothetical protein